MIYCATSCTGTDHPSSAAHSGLVILQSITVGWRSIEKNYLVKPWGMRITIKELSLRIVETGDIRDYVSILAGIKDLSRLLPVPVFRIIVARYRLPYQWSVVIGSRILGVPMSCFGGCRYSQKTVLRIQGWNRLEIGDEPLLSESEFLVYGGRMSSTPGFFLSGYGPPGLGSLPSFDLGICPSFRDWGLCPLLDWGFIPLLVWSLELSLECYRIN